MQNVSSNPTPISPSKKKGKKKASPVQREHTHIAPPRAIGARAEGPPPPAYHPPYPSTGDPGSIRGGIAPRRFLIPSDNGAFPPLAPNCQHFYARPRPHRAALRRWGPQPPSSVQAGPGQSPSQTKRGLSGSQG